MYNCNYSKDATIDPSAEKDRFRRALRLFRRATLSGSLAMMLHSCDLAELSMPQVFALLVLDERGECSIKDLADLIGRTVSTTSRLVDQSVGQGLVSRCEDPVDRRAKRVSITPEGHALIASIEEQRIAMQVKVFDQLAPEQRAIVIHAMELLAEASTRGRQHDDQPASSDPPSNQSA